MIRSTLLECRAVSPQPDESAVFPKDFLIAIRTLVNVHHSIYPRVPPQGIYFEALVEEAFRKIKKPFTIVERTSRNQPINDLLVEDARISLKTETGIGTRENQICITKLCTTEREPWAPDVLIERVIEHLSRYDVILMLRAIWKLPLIHYQLVDVPVEMLRLIRSAKLDPVGRRKGRQSLGADVYRAQEGLFRVHFDGSDGKCQIRNLPVAQCVLLEEWDLQIAG